VLSVYHFEAELGLRSGLPREELARALDDGGGVLWVDLESPSEEEAALLGGLFGFHPLAIEDCREAAAYPKLDDFESHVFLVMLAPDQLSAEQEDPVMLGLNLFIGSNYVVTFHKRPLRSISELRSRVSKAPGQVMGKSSAFLAHAILDALVDQHYAAVESLDDAVERYQDLILERPRKGLLDRILALRSHVLQLRRILTDERNIMAQFAHGVVPLVGIEEQRYFSDVYEHLDELGDKLDVSRDGLAGARDLYLSVSAHRTNETMRFLAIIATVMLPLTFLTGLYGMNVRLPGGIEPAGSYVPFFALLGVMAAVAAGLFGYFRWRGWA
jgi:magnesium transporter